MKFEVGDRVVVVKSAERSLMVGMTGTIDQIHEGSSLPYLVRDDGNAFSWFAEDELELA
jgi:hypothetical protein